MKKELEIKKPNFPFIVEDMVNAKNKALKNQKISNLKKELENSDYKIIKCYEASLTNQPLPYNIVELKAERDSIREQIRRLHFQHK